MPEQKKRLEEAQKSWNLTMDTIKGLTRQFKSDEDHQAINKLVANLNSTGAKLFESIKFCHYAPIIDATLDIGYDIGQMDVIANRNYLGVGKKVQELTTELFGNINTHVLADILIKHCDCGYAPKKAMAGDNK